MTSGETEREKKNVACEIIEVNCANQLHKIKLVGFLLKEKRLNTIQIKIESPVFWAFTVQSKKKEWLIDLWPRKWVVCGIISKSDVRNGQNWSSTL